MRRLHVGMGIKRYLAIRKMTQIEFAYRISVTRETVNRWCNGTQQVEDWNMRMIRKTIGHRTCERYGI